MIWQGRDRQIWTLARREFCITLHFLSSAFICIWLEVNRLKSVLWPAVNRGTHFFNITNEILHLAQCHWIFRYHFKKATCQSPEHAGAYKWHQSHIQDVMRASLLLLKCCYRHSAAVCLHRESEDSKRRQDYIKICLYHALYAGT